MALRVRDRAPGSAPVELDLDLEGSRFTAAELIRARVLAELMERGGSDLQPLVEVTPAEEALNGPRPDRTSRPHRSS